MKDLRENELMVDANSEGDKKEILSNNSGMGTVEIILIIVVLISLVIIFRNQITDFVKGIFSNITKSAAIFDPTK